MRQLSVFWRRGLLGAALVTSIGFSIWSPEEGGARGDVVVPVRQPPRVPIAPSSSERLPMPPVGELIERATWDFGAGDPFSSHSASPATMLPPMAVSALPSEPPVQTTPPLPFVFVGKIDLHDGKWGVYLAKGEQQFAVKPGEVFDSLYRLETFEGGNLVIRYLPLSTKQLLPINPS